MFLVGSGRFVMAEPIYECNLDTRSFASFTLRHRRSRSLMTKTPRLSLKSVQVLKLIAEGHSYAQIVDASGDLTYHDIFFAAEEAVWLNERVGVDGEPGEVNAMTRAKMMHPRAYAPWSEEEDSRLAAMFAHGMSRREIAEQLQRQPSAIASRLRKRGLVQD